MKDGEDEQGQQQQQRVVVMPLIAMDSAGAAPPSPVPLAQQAMDRQGLRGGGDMMEEVGGSLVPFKDEEWHRYVNSNTCQQILCAMCCPACQVGLALHTAQRGPLRSCLCCMLMSLGLGSVAASTSVATGTHNAAASCGAVLGICAARVIPLCLVAREVNYVNEAFGGDSHVCRYTWYLMGLPCLFSWQVARAVQHRVVQSGGAGYTTMGR